MQADPGRTTERRSGTRAATTFRKLPTASPGAKKTAARAMSTRRLRRELGRERRRVDGVVAGHSDRHEREAAEGRARRLPEQDGVAVDRAVDEGGRADVDRVRAVDRAFEPPTHELHAVAGAHLAVGSPRR